MDPASFTDSSQRCRSCPLHFLSILPILAALTIWDLPPVSNWFSVRVFPHVSVFFICLWGIGEGGKLHILLLCHLDPPFKELIFLKCP